MEDSHFSQNVMNWVGGLIAGLLSIIYGIGLWVFLRYAKKVDDIEQQNKSFVERDDIQKNYATQKQIDALELRVAQMVSRKELIAHMSKWVDDRQKMHNENMERFTNVIEDLRESRKDLREVHKRIDDLFNK